LKKVNKTSISLTDGKFCAASYPKIIDKGSGCAFVVTRKGRIKSGDVKSSQE
jgi:hypothetical protein